ncbi:L-threonine aldolase [Prosthecobacter debontii]|uniref:L-threonine aldolase n=1 Tax=Prosthecobacter debontii TaxID=48467 RepID=A0A1T4Y9Z1_9BACT|nr:low specificity L-threonine aldolase [Prosthecobacter debontii]SKA98599.1 L-threonine aldolase [Prosthecobacter debontii]
MKYHFASDNTSGVCPEAWQAMAEANVGYHPSYGADAITAEACESFRRFFDTDCEVFFVFNGTAANSLALASLCQSYHSVICSDLAHVETDECGAPEFFSNGSKLLTAKSSLGKLDPTDVERLITHRTDLHYPRPKALSLSQSTELGTVYRPGEIAGLCKLAKSHGLHVHMDGARFFNALAAQTATPADLTWKAGVDVLCCGGTKLGMAVTEAVVFFNHDLARDFEYRCKQAGQLCSKMRFISAQWLRILNDDTWRQHAARANGLARKLADGLGQLPGAQILYPVDANAVFARLPETMKSGLKERGWMFYSFIGGGSRLMCSWATTEADVDTFIADAQAWA